MAFHAALIPRHGHQDLPLKITSKHAVRELLRPRHPSLPDTLGCHLLLELSFEIKPLNAVCFQLANGCLWATRKPSNSSVCVIAVASPHLAVFMPTTPLKGGQV